MMFLYQMKKIYFLPVLEVCRLSIFFLFTFQIVKHKNKEEWEEQGIK